MKKIKQSDCCLPAKRTPVPGPILPSLSCNLFSSAIPGKSPKPFEPCRLRQVSKLGSKRVSHLNAMWIGAEAVPRSYATQVCKVVQENRYGGVPIGADRDPAQLKIIQQLEVFGSDLMWSRFGAYPQPHFSYLL
jgi:hypothetical protein